MTPEFISRIVGLVRTQGDRVVLADSVTGKAVVIMDLDQYERLCVGQTQAVAPAQVAPAAPIVPVATQEPVRMALEPASIEQAVGPRVEAPFRAPELPPKKALQTVVEEAPKIAKQSDNPFKKRANQMGVETTPAPQGLRDLTQAELLDKINRDIGDWKTAQERKRTDELTSVVRQAPRAEAVTAVEEEERFYLEPIE